MKMKLTIFILFFNLFLESLDLRVPISPEQEHSIVTHSRYDESFFDMGYTLSESQWEKINKLENKKCFNRSILAFSIFIGSVFYFHYFFLPGIK